MIISHIDNNHFLSFKEIFPEVIFIFIQNESL